MRPVQETSRFLILLAAGFGLASPSIAGDDVPTDARVERTPQGIVVRHWTRPLSDAGSVDVLGTVEVPDWPKDAWGVEIRIIPIPNCCGAREYTVRWRKSQRPTPRFLGRLDDGSRYRVDARFR